MSNHDHSTTDTHWRRGRPIEDPDKTKRWGYVTAKPSEFLVHCRRGRVMRTSGQGASCFKWPWDSVAVVPTSIQRLSFRADQVTREKVGIEVRGLAVYRIADPLLAFRVLNFSYPERAQEKLMETLTDMLIGATRRLVANLTVEECLQKRKAALADELLHELVPVLGGMGRPEDRTDRGWGVVVDTVEIQEVRVLSEQVFAAMQAPHRSSLSQQARLAKAEAERVSAVAEADARRQVQEQQLNAEASVRARRGEIDRREAENRSTETIAAVERATREEEARVRGELERHRMQTEELQSEIDGYSVRDSVYRLRSELDKLLRNHEMDMLRNTAAADAAAETLRAEAASIRAAADKEAAIATARVLTAENLPALADALGQKFGEINVTHFGGDGDPMMSVAKAVRSVLVLAESIATPTDNG